MSETYNQILDLLRRVVKSHPDTVWSSGADFNDVAENVTAMGALTTSQNGDEVRLRLVTPEAADAFEWVGELTFIPPQKPQLRHFLLLKDGSIVEAYGRNLLDVKPDEATGLLLRLQMLAESLAEN